MEENARERYPNFPEDFATFEGDKTIMADSDLVLNEAHYSQVKRKQDTYGQRHPCLKVELYARDFFRPFIRLQPSEAQTGLRLSQSDLIASETWLAGSKHLRKKKNTPADTSTFSFMTTAE